MPEIPVLLRTAPRDIRAARVESRAMRRSPHTRAAAFAQAIADRFTVRAWPWLPPSLTFVRDHPAVAVQYLQQHSHTHVAPRLALTVLAWHAPQPGPSAGEPARPASRLRVEQEVRTLRTVVRVSETSASELLVRRILSQGSRVEVVPVAAQVPASRGVLREPSRGEASRAARAAGPAGATHRAAARAGGG